MTRVWRSTSILLLLPWFGCSADGVPLDPTTLTDSGTADSGTLADAAMGTPDSGALKQAPLVTVEFPAAFSLTDATFVTMRGVASDEDGVKAVRVNGFIADSNSDFASWELNLQLSPGENTFVVSTEDRLGNTDLDAARVVVTSEPLLFIEPWAVAIDPATRRALLVDPTHDRLVALDLENGDRVLISGDSRGSGPALSSPVDIAVDAANRRAIVLDAPPFPDSTQSALVAIDLGTGDRTIISDATTGPPFSAPRGVAVDDVNNRALVLESGSFGALIAIDLDTGDRTIVSDDATGSGRSLQNCTALAWDATQGRAIAVVDTSGGTGLIAIDLDTGNRTSITDPALEFGMQRPHGVALDAAGDRALVGVHVGGWAGGLLAIDLNTGDRSVVSDRTIGTGPDFQGMVAVSFDAVTRRAHVISQMERGGDGDLYFTELFTVDVDIGDRAFASVHAIGAGPPLTSPTGVALDADNNRALVGDQNLQREVGGARRRNSGVLVAVDLNTGDRTIVSEPQIEAGNAFWPADMTLDESKGRVLVVDVGRNLLVSIDLNTGADAIEAAAPEPMRMSAVALDAATNRALITGYSGGGGTSMVAIDLSNGNQSVLIDTNPGDDFWTLDGVTVDDANATAFVTSERTESLFALDLVTGDRTVIADAAIGTGTPLWSPGALVVDSSERRAIVLNAVALLAVDLDSGHRTILSDAETGAGPMFTRATDVAQCSSPHCVWVVDEALDALLLVDLVTGQRVIASGHLSR